MNTQETIIDLDIPESEKLCEECDLLPHIGNPKDIIDEEREKALRKGLIHTDSWLTNSD